MNLGTLLAEMNISTSLPRETRDREVRDIAYDSRKVTPGSVFVAVRGSHSDGHQFIPEAGNKGAIAVIAETIGGVVMEKDIPVVRVLDSRAALARAATVFYEYPSRKIKLIGITGTKGKTTTSYLVKSVVEAAGHAAGLIGTIDYRVGGNVYPAPNTTPESADLQKLLAEMVQAGEQYCVMEVSSHALALGRTAGCEFEAAMFTNLQQDHLDFHRNREAYFEAKLLLFTGLAPGKAVVVNADEEASREIIRNRPENVVTFGMTDAADIHPAEKIRESISGLSFIARTPRGEVCVKSPLVGNYNAYNILAAIGMGIALGFSPDVISQGIGSMKTVPGRMEKIDEGQLFGVVVDYAHTEESLAGVLDAVRPMAKGNVITVFGCGGDRDRNKRPKMGAAAMGRSDIVIVTSDNPRSEDPHDIIREIEPGMIGNGGARMGGEKTFAAPLGKKPYYVLPDRSEAIAAAVRMAEAGDVVVIAGKGHEDYQIIGRDKIYFDDRETARKEIRRKLKQDAGCKMQDAG